jgi:hypothetical protein
MPLYRKLFGLLILLNLVACRAPGASPMVETETTSQKPANSPTLAAESVQPVRVQTIEEAAQLAGFQVWTPAYLPEGVSLYYATYQAAPAPQATLYYKIVHPQYGDMGGFFQLIQEPRPQAPPDTTTCGPGDGTCELLEIDGTPVVYHLYSAGTEGLDWYRAGMVFRLLRTAGEPGKVYRDELVKVAAGLK